MVAGMMIGGWVTGFFQTESVPLAVLVGYFGMTLGMIVGMLLGTAATTVSINALLRLRNQPEADEKDVPLAARL